MAEVMEWIKSLSNDELVHHLMTDYGYKCGPITVSTRSVYEKKLQSFKNNTTISGKAIPAQQTRTNGSNDHHEENEKESHDAVTKLYLSADKPSPRKGRKSLPLPSTSTRSKSSGDPMRDVKLNAPGVQPKSKKSIDLNFDDDEDSDESKSQRRSARRVTITSPIITPKAPGRKPVRISTPGPSALSAYSSAEEDDDDVGSERADQVPSHSSGVFSRLNKSLGIGEKQPAVKFPKSVLPSAHGMPKVRTSTPMTKISNNTSVFGNSSISSSSIGRRTSSRSIGSRIPSSLRVEPPSASSLANFSDDNDSENELGALSSHNSIDSPPSVNLLRYRPRSSGVVRGSKTRNPLSNITTQSTDYSPNRSGSIWSSFLSSSSASATSSPSSWISISILIVALLFFISIFSFYFYSRITSPTSVQTESSMPFTDKVTKNDDDDNIIISKLKAPPCSVGQSHLDPCLKSKNHVKPALIVIRQVASIFEQQCIKHFCEAADESFPAFSDPTVMNVNSFRSQLIQILTNSPDFLKLARENIELDTDNKDKGIVTLLLVNKAITDSLVVLELNPMFKIKVLKDERSIITHLRIDVKTFPINWPWKCRFTMAIIDAIWILSIISVILFISFSLYYFINLSKKRRSEEEELKYELIEKSLELLQSPDEPQSMPILHIRDTLISPLDRTDSKNIRVWNEVVKFIEGNESRVKIDSEVIDGETYRTWKWVASQVSMDGSYPGALKTGDIEWQGQAFNENDAVKSSSSSRRSTIKTPGQSDSESFVAPTCFIKARNLFDIDEVRNSTDPSWQEPIKDAILKKCALRTIDGDHGIQHIYFEGDHSREALVYMKCKNIESATNAYLALHGWWCERKLVSVRFLKEDRYYQRFPEAKNANSTLET